MIPSIIGHHATSSLIAVKEPGQQGGEEAVAGTEGLRRCREGRRRDAGRARRAVAMSLEFDASRYCGIRSRPPSITTAAAGNPWALIGGCGARAHHLFGSLEQQQLRIAALTMRGRDSG